MAPAAYRVGVDVLPVRRVGTRHMVAILDAAEIQIISRLGSPLAPAVAWTLKEAALKASGVADLLTPADLRIHTCDRDGGAAVGVTGTGLRLAGGWWVSGGFVYAWMIGPASA